MLDYVESVFLNTVQHCWIQYIKWPSHVKLMLANSCWQTQIGVCERHNNMLANCWRQIELVSILANSLPTCCCVVHTHQFEFANTSWPTLVWRVKAALNTFSHPVEWCWFNFSFALGHERQCWIHLFTLSTSHNVGWRWICLTEAQNCSVTASSEYAQTVTKPL